MVTAPKTTPKKATTRATATPKASKPAVNPGADPAGTSGPAGVTSPLTTPVVLRKKGLIEDAVARCGVKKKDAKPAIEAALAVIGDALAAGEELNLPPMGKVKIQRVIVKPNAKVMVARIRQPNSTRPEANVPLANTTE